MRIVFIGCLIAATWLGRPVMARSPIVPPSLATPTLQLTPALTALAPGDDITLTLTISNASNLGSYETIILFDPTVITVTNVAHTDLASNGGQRIPIAFTTIGADNVHLGVATLDTAPGYTGDGVLAMIHVVAVGGGTGSLTPSNVILTDITGMHQPVASIGAQVQVQIPSATPTITSTPLPTGTPTLTATSLIQASATQPATATPTPTDTATQTTTATPSDTAQATTTALPTGTLTQVPSTTSTVTNPVEVSPTQTATSTPSPSETATQTSPATPSPTATPSETTQSTATKTPTSAHTPQAATLYLTTVRESVAHRSATAASRNVVTVSLGISDAVGIGSYEVLVTFKASQVTLTKISQTGLLAVTGRNTLPLPIVSVPDGVRFGAVTLGSGGGFSGDGTLATMTFFVLKPGLLNFNIGEAIVTKVSSERVPVSNLGASLTITQGTSPQFLPIVMAP